MELEVDLIREEDNDSFGPDLNSSHSLLFQKRLLMYRLFEKLEFHSSENQQQNIWILTL